MTNKNTEWRENSNQNDSDEDSAYQSQNKSGLNVSALSASTAIANESDNSFENITQTKTPETPRGSQISGRLKNLNLNEENPEPENFNMAEGEERPPRNNGIGPIHQAVSNLPYFDGNPRMLRQFITSLQHLHDSYGENFDQWILTYIPNRLKGRALLAFGGNASTYANINEFLEAVKTEFGGIHDIDTLRMELYQVEQDENETISEYSTRVKDIEQRLLAAYEATLDPNEEIPAQDPAKQRLIEDILEAFLHGLRNPPEYQVAIKNPTSLAEASRYAETLEKKQQFILGHRNVAKTKKISPIKTKASTLKIPLEDDNDDDSENNDLALLIKLMKELKDSAHINVTTASKSAENKKQGMNDQMTCKFCKNKGHEMSSCQLFLQIIDQNMDKLRYSAGIQLEKEEMMPYERNSFNPFNRNYFSNRPYRTSFNDGYNANQFSQGFNNQNYNNYRRNNYMNYNRNNFNRNFSAPTYFERPRLNDYSQNTGSNNYSRNMNSNYNNNRENFYRSRFGSRTAENNENFNKFQNVGQNYLNYSRQTKHESPGNFRQTMKDLNH